MSNFIDAILRRRSIYGISDQIPVSDEQLKAMLRDIIRNMPTAFNMQSTRMVLLLGTEHAKLWQLVQDTLQLLTPPEKFEATKKKLASFSEGHGTILFFDDSAITNQYAADYATYRDLFPDWALQQNGMLQYTVWTALAELGIGASLQHYNPIIDQSVADAFSVPQAWRLLAQMPFGAITQPAGEKDFAPVEERFWVRE